MKITIDFDSRYDDDISIKSAFAGEDLLFAIDRFYRSMEQEHEQKRISDTDYGRIVELFNEALNVFPNAEMAYRSINRTMYEQEGKSMMATQTDDLSAPEDKLAEVEKERDRFREALVKIIDIGSYLPDSYTPGELVEIARAALQEGEG